MPLPVSRARTDSMNGEMALSNTPDLDDIDAAGVAGR